MIQALPDSICISVRIRAGAQSSGRYRGSKKASGFSAAARIPGNRSVSTTRLASVSECAAAAKHWIPIIQLWTGSSLSWTEVTGVYLTIWNSAWARRRSGLILRRPPNTAIMQERFRRCSRRSRSPDSPERTKTLRCWSRWTSIRSS
ncbi:hypothetical protein D3C75_955750 [compost metagenome]